LSPAKVNQVRITDIENRQMEVIVNEDQLSLAIGKRGQNVRLATKLVGWNIDIRSEEELKKEVAEAMGAMIASGAPVPLSVIEGVTSQQADALAEHNVNDIDGLAATTVDDLVEFLDVSLDEAEKILAAAQSVIQVRDRSRQPGEDETAEGQTEGGSEIQQHAASAELDEDAPATEVAPNDDMTAAGYDEAVEQGVPFSAEQTIRAEDSADPVALTEADPMSVDELILQEAGRDLRPDVVTPAPDSSLAVDPVEVGEEVDTASPDEQIFAPSPDDVAATDESTEDEKR
jgi:N utilization substance protein A